MVTPFFLGIVMIPQQAHAHVGDIIQLDKPSINHANKFKCHIICTTYYFLHDNRSTHQFIWVADDLYGWRSGGERRGYIQILMATLLFKINAQSVLIHICMTLYAPPSILQMLHIIMSTNSSQTVPSWCSSFSRDTSTTYGGESLGGIDTFPFLEVPLGLQR